MKSAHPLQFHNSLVTLEETRIYDMPVTPSDSIFVLQECGQNLSLELTTSGKGIIKLLFTECLLHVRPFYAF